MKQYCENALTVAKFLESNDKVESVAYPGLESDKYHKLAEKYLPLGTAGVISFVIKGGRDTAAKFMDSLKLASNEVHVADIRTCNTQTAFRRTARCRRHKRRNDKTFRRP